MTDRDQMPHDRCRRQPALLIWWDGDLVRDQWILDRDVSTIGRAADCDIQMDNRWISRTHARIRREQDGYWLEDAGSKNGLFVNGKRVTDARQMEDGDRVQLAPGLELLFADSEATWPLPRAMVADIVVDQAERSVFVRGRQLVPPLSVAQHDLLALLAQEPGRVYSRADVVAATWPDASPEGVTDDAVDALLRRLRQRLAEVDTEREHIVTVRGYGFKLNPELRVERKPG